MTIFILSCLLVVAPFNQELSPAEVFGKIQERFAKINDLSVSFTQTVKMRYQHSARQQSGTIKVKTGNKYRIETSAQTIVTDGKTIWMYTPATAQVLIDEFKTNRHSFSPDKFLLGLPKELSAVAVTRDSLHYILTLKLTEGRAASSLITVLKVWTTPGVWTVEKLEFTDTNGTTTTITLSSIEVNKGIADKNFQFEITKEMNVVHMKTLQ